MTDLTRPFQPSIDDARYRAYQRLLGRLDAIDLAPLLIYRIASVGSDVLPTLAWQFSLTGADGWNVAETDAQRRDLIQNSILLHRTKGTADGIEQALARVGYPSARVHERVRETEPGPAARYDGARRFDGEINYDARTVSVGRSWATFRVSLDVADYDRARLSLADLRGVIESYKRAVCHLTDISFRVDAPVEQVAVSDHATADLVAPLADVWWQGLRYDGTARAVGGAVPRYDGARAFDGLGTFDGLAVPEGAPIYRYQAGPYPEAVTAEAGLGFFDRHVIPARFDGALRFDGTGHFDGSATGFRDKGVDLLIFRNGVLAFSGGPYPAVAAPDAALTAGAWGAVTASQSYTGGEF